MFRFISGFATRHLSRIMTPYEDSSRPLHSAAPSTRRVPAWAWVLIGFCSLVTICCGGLVAGLFYIGVSSPETSVYIGNQVPAAYLSVAREVGGLKEGENVRYFYSDGFMDVRDAFYYVSDQKVAVYVNDGREAPLTEIPFDHIRDASLERDESFFEDSQIVLELKDDSLVAFPVSSEFDRDMSFFDEIQQHRQSD